jgi:TolB-like protein/DNA-binding SARP family transcriptional activator
LRTLGTLALTNSAGESILGGHGHHKRRLALLSVLAAAGDRGRSRDQLMLLFWPEATQTRARHSLDQLLYALRNSVSEDVFAGVNPVRLNDAVIASDVGDFLSALERNDLAAAADAYGGTFLDGFFLGDSPEFEQWVDAERARLIARYTETLDELAHASAATNDRAGATRWRRALTETDPLSGQYAANYMRALANAGDRAAALRHGERYAALVSRELGVDAGPEVTNIAAELRTATPQPVAVEHERIDPASHSHTTAATNGASRPRDARTVRRRVRWPFLVVAGALIAALSVVGAQWMRSRSTALSPAARSIVVLPFANAGGDPRDAAIVDGLTEELIAALAKLGQLKVIDRTSAFAFKSSDLDVRRIADSLGVAYVLTSSVQKDSLHLRVHVELVNARDGSTRWAESYQSELRDIFRVQSQIAGAVARELDVRLGASELARIKRGSTANPAAHEMYLKGNDPMMLRTDSTVQMALGYVDEAIRLDPNYAAAYTARARLLARSMMGDDTSRSQVERRALAEQSVLKALALDDSLADAHATLGVMRRDRLDFATGETELKRAVALEPATARFHEWLVQLYIATARPAEALTEGRRAVELDPLSPTANAELAHALVANHRPDEALALLAPLESLRPPLLRARPIAAQAYAQKQMWTEAIAEMSRNLPNAAPIGRAFLGYLFARAGRTKEAHAILASMLDHARQSGRDQVEIAMIYTGLGDKDNAFAWLARLDSSLLGARSEWLRMMLADLEPDPRVAGVRQRLLFQKR